MLGLIQPLIQFDWQSFADTASQIDQLFAGQLSGEYAEITGRQPDFRAHAGRFQSGEIQAVVKEIKIAKQQQADESRERQDRRQPIIKATQLFTDGSRLAEVLGNSTITQKRVADLIIMMLSQDILGAGQRKLSRSDATKKLMNNNNLYHIFDQKVDGRQLCDHVLDNLETARYISKE